MSTSWASGENPFAKASGKSSSYVAWMRWEIRATSSALAPGLHWFGRLIV
jgi:hypothetical protein